MNLIILILANDTDVYLKMQEKWQSYMNKHSHIKSYFIKYKEDLKENIIQKEDTIYVKGNESLIPGCLDKTIKSIEYLLNNFDFNFIFRTNMSSVVDLNKLYNLIHNHSEDEIKYGGFINTSGVKFISGAGILMNKQTCQLLIDNKNALNYNIIDDVCIGQFMTDKNIKFTSLTRFEAYNYEKNIDLITKDNIINYYHFRCKSDIDHIKTIELMTKIINLIY
jgi:hypothetical protein